MKTILIFTNYYLPGYKSGGPIRSISNIVDWLGNEFNFKIVALDRDSFEDNSYSGININSWNRVGNADVYYINKQNLNIINLYKLIKKTEFDAVYLNSFFNIWFSVIPLLVLKFFNRFDSRKILLVPRGEFSEGAMDQKQRKKKFFIKIIKIFKLHKNILWQATNEDECKEIKRFFRVEPRDIYIVSNLPNKNNSNINFKFEKTEGEIHIIYLSRVTPKKNLLFALKALDCFRRSDIKIIFNIYGLITDDDYWKTCKEYIDSLPININAYYKGVIKHDLVIETINKHHLFLLPTKGENYGHAIYESMIAGTPVLISNKTPWVNLEEKKLGWSFPLDNIELFVKVIKDIALMNNEQVYRLKKDTYNNSLKINILQSVSQTRLMFLSLIK